MENRQNYFEEALSDFVHDVASGGAIRHLVDLGYSVEQMMGALSYPAPRERVQKTAYRYMMESGLLLAELPRRAGAETAGSLHDGGAERAADFRTVRLPVSDAVKVNTYLYQKIEENGEDSSYFSCPFGTWASREVKTDRNREWLRDRLCCLSKREQDYIVGIPWANAVMYHRLNGRMKDIGRKLFLHMEPGCRYYFLKTEEIAEAICR